MIRFSLVRSFAAALAAGALIVVFSGCSATSSAGNDYYTVARDPRRNTDAARHLTAQAAQLITDHKADQAQKLLQQALHDDIMYGPAHNDLGMVYYQQKKLYLAAWEFEYASKLMPNRPEPRNNLGMVFVAAGKMDDAVNAYSQALAIEPDNAQIIGNLVRAKIRRGDHDPQVRDLLQQLVMKDTRPQWVAWARRHLALMHVEATPPAATAPKSGDHGQ